MIPNFLSYAIYFISITIDTFTTNIESQYILYIVGFIALIMLLYIGSRLLSIVFKSRSEKFSDALQSYETISIIMHHNPDPDAMASAMTIKHICDYIGVEAEILYSGNISHHENRAFRTVLDVQFTRIEDIDEITSEGVVLVDHNQIRQIDEDNDIHPNIIIDHHSENINEDDYKFCYIDPNVGACSSILTEFLYELDLLSEEFDDKLATALYHGIKSDTKNFSKKVSEIDFTSINRLYKYIDEDKLYRISNPKIDDNSLETKARAIMGRKVRGPFSVSDVGSVQNTDSIPQATDELIQLEGISSVVVIGTHNNLIRMSGRSHDDRTHLGEALNSVVQDIDGASAGGHADSAGGSIPIKSMESQDITRDEIINRIFDAMDG